MGNYETNYEALRDALRDSGLARERDLLTGQFLESNKQFKTYIKNPIQGITGRPVGLLADVQGSQAYTGLLYTENCKELFVFFNHNPAPGTTLVANFATDLDEEATLAYGSTIANQTSTFLAIGIAASAPVFPNGNLASPYFYSLPIPVLRRMAFRVSSDIVARILVWGRE